MPARHHGCRRHAHVAPHMALLVATCVGSAACVNDDGAEDGCLPSLKCDGETVAPRPNPLSPTVLAALNLLATEAFFTNNTFAQFAQVGHFDDPVLIDRFATAGFGEKWKTYAIPVMPNDASLEFRPGFSANASTGSLAFMFLAGDGQMARDYRFTFFRDTEPTQAEVRFLAPSDDLGGASFYTHKPIWSLPSLSENPTFTCTDTFVHNAGEWLSQLPELTARHPVTLRTKPPGPTDATTFAEEIWNALPLALQDDGCPAAFVELRLLEVTHEKTPMETLANIDEAIPKDTVGAGLLALLQHARLNYSPSNVSVNEAINLLQVRANDTGMDIKVAWFELDLQPDEGAKITIRVFLYQNEYRQFAAAQVRSANPP